MLIPPKAYEALLNTGLRISAANRDSRVDIELMDSSGKTRATFQVKRWDVPVGGAIIDRLAVEADARQTSLLLIAPRFSDRTRAAIENQGWSWLAIPDTGEPHGQITFPDGHSTRVTNPDTSEWKGIRRRGPRSYGRFALMRLLLTTSEPWSQSDLADAVGLTQPRVSQVLRQLSTAGLAHRQQGHRGRWLTPEWNALLDHWLDTYPGPGGVTTYWYGLDTVEVQAREVIKLLSKSTPHANNLPVASADAAAEFIAPYRRPLRALIYSKIGADLQPLGLTPAQESASTLALVVPDDSSVWPRLEQLHWLHPDAPFGIADPVQVIWDLLQAPGSDADQAAQAVRARLLAHAHSHG